MKIRLMYFALLMAPCISSANDAAALSRCASVLDARERLECYDMQSRNLRTEPSKLDPAKLPAAQQSEQKSTTSRSSTSSPNQALPERMKCTWRTDDGRYSNTHEITINTTNGEAVRGVILIWSSSCGKPAPFTGTWNGSEFTLEVGSDGPCSPASQRYKRGTKDYLEGTWSSRGYTGTATCNPI